jgi:hypothetical protein
MRELPTDMCEKIAALNFQGGDFCCLCELLIVNGGHVLDELKHFV